jgi:hypothetical protein
MFASGLIVGSLRRGFTPLSFLPPLLRRRGVHPEGFSLKGTKGVRMEDMLINITNSCRIILYHQ